MKNLLTILFLLLFSSVNVFAQESASALTRTMKQSGFSNEQVARVQNMIRTTEQKGLPSEPISSKVHEGIAKGVQPSKVIQAVERVRSRYEYGYNLARQVSRDKTQITRLGNIMTQGIAAGLTPEDCQRLVSRLQTRAKEMKNREQLYSLSKEAMLTARDLARHGASSTATADLVGRAVEKGFSANEIQEMNRSLNRQRAHGDATSLARGYGNAIDQGIQSHELESYSREHQGHGRDSASGNDNGSGGSGDGTGNGNDGGSGDSGDSGGNGNDGGSGDSGGSGGNGNDGGSGDSGGSGGNGNDGGSGDSGGGGGNGNDGGSGSNGGGYR